MPPNETPGTPGAPKRWINFDAVLPETIEVTRGGRTLHLRDDVPMVDTVRVFTLLELQDELRGQREGIDAAGVQDWYARISGAALDLATAFIRHSYPEMTAAEVASWLDFDQQMQLVMLFFQLRSRTFSALPSALTGGSDDSASSVDAAETANRATRRAKAAKPGPRGATTRRR